MLLLKCHVTSEFKDCNITLTPYRTVLFFTLTWIFQNMKNGPNFILVTETATLPRSKHGSMAPFIHIRAYFQLHSHKARYMITEFVMQTKHRNLFHWNNRFHLTIVSFPLDFWGCIPCRVCEYTVQYNCAFHSQETPFNKATLGIFGDNENHKHHATHEGVSYRACF